MTKVLQPYDFQSVLSLRLLVEYWEGVLESSNGDSYKASILARLRDAPELLEPIYGPEVLVKHEKLVADLMMAVFPPALWETQAMVAVAPFTLEPIWNSPYYRTLMLRADGEFRSQQIFTREEVTRAKVVRAYTLILRKYYGINEGLDDPMVYGVPDPETGLLRYFKLKTNFRFVDVINHGGPDTLTDAERETVLENLSRPEVLKNILDPSKFEFRGFTAIEAIDVTDTHVVSLMERDLVDTVSIFSLEGFTRLQERLRTLFKKPNLVAGLCAIRDDYVMLLNTGCDIAKNCIFSGSRHMPLGVFKGTVFDRASQGEEVLRVRDIKDEPNNPVHDMIVEHGGTAMLIAPLHFQGELLGTLDLGADQAGAFGPTDSLLLERILPVFSMAMKRGLDDFNHEVQKIIKEKCTAVHPSVEWAFQKAVFNHLERLHRGETSELEPIVFRDVYPLYAAADIRGSSEARNEAIRADLSEHLELALNIISVSKRVKDLPILQELSHRVELYMESLDGGLTSGDEMAVIGFLGHELEGVYPLLQTFGPEVRQAVADYENAVDRSLGTVYRSRCDFEKSVSVFNERISSYLDREEAEAQEIFPHYFNKHQTDGVEYVIYIGASTAENGGFDELYVKNLRLWQLMVSCGVAWHVDEIKNSLKAPLAATHLVLVHHSPLSIRFRFDEKRFDVDGAYDIAHEIVRSRIDKATVRGGKERLTQPERIAVVYSTAEEQREMSTHISFLQAKGFLNDDVENLTLDDLPGVPGLKALRVGINLGSHALRERVERIGY